MRERGRAGGERGRIYSTRYLSVGEGLEPVGEVGRSVGRFLARSLAQPAVYVEVGRSCLKWMRSRTFRRVDYPRGRAGLFVKSLGQVAHPPAGARCVTAKEYAGYYNGDHADVDVHVDGLRRGLLRGGDAPDIAAPHATRRFSRSQQLFNHSSPGRARCVAKNQPARTSPAYCLFIAGNGSPADPPHDGASPFQRDLQISLGRFSPPFACGFLRPFSP